MPSFKDVNTAHTNDAFDRLTNNLAPFPLCPNPVMTPSTKKTKLLFENCSGGIFFPIYIFFYCFLINLWNVNFFFAIQQPQLLLKSYTCESPYLSVLCSVQDSPNLSFWFLEGSAPPLPPHLVCSTCQHVDEGVGVGGLTERYPPLR